MPVFPVPDLPDEKLGWPDEWDARYRMQTPTVGSTRATTPRVADGDDIRSPCWSGGPVTARVAQVDPDPSGGRTAACLTAVGPVRVAVDPAVDPVPGDEVVLADGRLRAVLPRRTVLRRGQDAYDVRGAAIAANVDVALVVQPLVDGGSWECTERLLALATATGAAPVLVLSQLDRVTEPGRPRTRLADLIGLGIETVAVSTMLGHPGSAGLDRLRSLVGPDRTGVLLGPTGAGKTALVEALTGTTVVPARSGATLVPLGGGGFLIDTPGWSGTDWLTARYHSRHRAEQRERWRSRRAAGSVS